jgi:hypothetical protein
LVDLHQGATGEQSSDLCHACPPDGTYLSRQLFRWEQGELSQPETLALFQRLVESGVAWKSTGPARRTAAVLLRDGRIRRAL